MVDYSQPPAPDDKWITLHCAPEQTGTSGEVWTCGSLLALLLRDGGLGVLVGSLAGRRVVGLGSGTGIAEIMAARQGAAVILTDRPNALPLLRYNVKSNVPWADDFCAVLEHQWGAPIDSLLTQPLLGGSAPDFVLCCDIVYEPDHLPELCWTLDALCTSVTTALFTIKWRVMGKEAYRILLTFLLAPPEDGAGDGRAGEPPGGVGGRASGRIERSIEVGGWTVHALDVGQPTGHYVLHVTRRDAAARCVRMLRRMRAVRLRNSDVIGIVDLGEPVPPPSRRGRLGSWMARRRRPVKQ